MSRYFKHVSALVNASTSTFGNIKFESIKWDDILQQIEINIKSNYLISEESDFLTGETIRVDGG